MAKNWYEMTLEELVEAGYQPVMIQHSDENGWEEVKENNEENQ